MDAEDIVGEGEAAGTVASPPDPDGVPRSGRDTRSRLSRAWANWRRPLAVAVGATLGFRLVVTWIALVSADGVGFPHVVARHPRVLADILFQWDGSFYMTLAAHGYPAHAALAHASQVNPRSYYAFGPLYPLLTRALFAVSGVRLITSAEIISTLALVVGLAALWKLVDLDVGPRAADASVVMLLAWPSAFFLVSTYAEAVVLAAGILAFLAVRRGHFVAAGLLAAAAAMGKYYLAIMLVPLAMEAWRAPRDQASWRAGRDLAWLTPLRVTAARLVALVAPTILAFVVWIAYQQAHFHDAFQFVHAQALWNRHLSWPWTSLSKAVSDIVHLRVLDTSVASTDELFSFVTIVLLGAAAVLAYLRLRPSYGIFLGMAWCVFAFQTLLISENREVLVLFPFFAALGVWVARHQWRERALLFLFLPCAYFLLERFVTGKFAG